MQPSDIDALIMDRPEDGVFKVNAAVFQSQEIFEAEMKYIFEGDWIYLGLSCQAPEPHDFFTTRMGRQPVIVSRDGDGELHGLINSCRHRGAMVCHTVHGNARRHICPYHAWTYDSAGRNVGITAKKQGGYPAVFDAEDHDLRRIPKFGEYRGFLFGSLNADVPPLEEHLGDARALIDLVVDQSAEGLELVPGIVHYTYNGNWKLQIENSADVYHFLPTHQSFVQILNGRAGNEAADSPYRNRSESEVRRGSFCFDYGHNVMWGGGDKVEARPLYIDKDEVEARVGAEKLKWMLYTRNALFFPNMQLLENASLQIRVNRPIGPDRTEITTYCIAPKGESTAARRTRIRQYEEFFNPSGLATPDDTTIFDDMQAGTVSGAVDWHLGYMRGMAPGMETPEKDAAELGVSPRSSILGPMALGEEVVLHGPLREWRRRLMEGLARDAGATAVPRAAE